MNKSFYRKMAYLIALVLLLFPMALLGAPSTRSEAGGKLAQLRSEAKLGQADLGAIDPASETIRMATLGLRGFAVTMLWNKANEYKKTEDWTSFEETLKQLARLQPYFVKVWQYQAWNLTYNVSVELDDVRDRFFYVKEGIKYLKEGTQYLRDNPTLLDDLGWFCGNKVGRADEHEKYRAMFKADNELHTPDTPAASRDNWLASREWYEAAISSIDDKKQPLGTKNPVTFFDSPARSEMSYAEAIEEEGILLSRWKAAWEEGGRLWSEYAKREMKSTDGYTIRMGDLEKEESDAKAKEEQLERMSPGLKKILLEEAQAKLTPQQQKVLKEPPAQPSSEESILVSEVQELLNITPQKVADRIAKDHPDKASEARILAKQIADDNARARAISINRDVANFEYWRVRCDIEQTSEALRARELAHEANRAFLDADLEKARKLYEESFTQWAAALDQVPTLQENTTFGSDLMDFVNSYNRVLEQLDLSLSDKEVANRFALWKVVELNDNERKFSDAIAAHQGQTTGVPKGTQSLVNPADALIY
jgi:hypothetical protein